MQDTTCLLIPHRFVGWVPTVSPHFGADRSGWQTQRIREKAAGGYEPVDFAGEMKFRAWEADNKGHGGAGLGSVPHWHCRGQAKGSSFRLLSRKLLHACRLRKEIFRRAARTCHKLFENKRLPSIDRPKRDG